MEEVGASIRHRWGIDGASLGHHWGVDDGIIGALSQCGIIGASLPSLGC